MTWHGNLAVDDAVALYEAMTGRRCDRVRAHAQLGELVDGGACPLYLLGRGRAGRGGWRPGRYGTDGKWIAGTRAPVRFDRLMRTQPDEGDDDYRPSRDYDHTALSRLLANMQGRRAALARLVVDERGPSLAAGGVVAGRALTGAELVDRAGWVNARALAEIGRPLITIGEGGTLVLAVDVPADLVPGRPKAQPAPARRPPARASAPPARKRRPQARAASVDDTLFDSMKRLRDLGQMRGGRVTLPSGDRRSGFLWRVAVRKTDRSCATWRDQAPHDDVVIGIVRTDGGPVAVVDPGPAGVRFSIRGELDEALRKVRAWSLGVADRDQPPAHHPAALQALLDGATVEWPDGWASAGEDDALIGDADEDSPTETDSASEVVGLPPAEFEPASPPSAPTPQAVVGAHKVIDRWSVLRRPPAAWLGASAPIPIPATPVREHELVEAMLRDEDVERRAFALADGRVFIDHAPSVDARVRRFDERQRLRASVGGVAQPGRPLATVFKAIVSGASIASNGQLRKRQSAAGRPKAISVADYCTARLEVAASGRRVSDGSVAEHLGTGRRLAARGRRLQIEQAAKGLAEKTGVEIGWGNGLARLAGARVAKRPSDAPADTSAGGVSPFIRWAGGKDRLLGEILDRMPPHIDHYVEACLGGGAVLLELLRQGRIGAGIANDRDPGLVELWHAVQSQPDEVHRLASQWAEPDTHYVVRPGHTPISGLSGPGSVLRPGDAAVDLGRRLEPSKSDGDRALREAGLVSLAELEFYRVRDEVDPATLGSVERAARQLYLLRRCYRGLMRRRKRDGGFNAPFGDARELGVTLDKLRAVADAIDAVTFVCGDAVDIIDIAPPGAVIYADPPYWPMSKTSNFVGYDGRGYGGADLVRLVEALERARRRGCFVIFSNSAVVEVLELLGPGWDVEVLGRAEGMRVGAGQSLEVLCSAGPVEAAQVAS